MHLYRQQMLSWESGQSHRLPACWLVKKRNRHRWCLVNIDRKYCSANISHVACYPIPKAHPTLCASEGSMAWKARPTHCPWSFSTGPPLFPGLMAARERGTDVVSHQLLAQGKACMLHMPERSGNIFPAAC